MAIADHLSTFRRPGSRSQCVCKSERGLSLNRRWFGVLPLGFVILRRQEITIMIKSKIKIMCEVQKASNLSLNILDLKPS